jgi:hypothetical protein
MQPPMGALALDDSQIGKRAEPRTNVAVMASMAAASASGSVMICNLSTRGGMIEAEWLPGVGERVELRRGEMLVVGQVVWRDLRKAGLKFDSRINVSDWLPTSHSGQQAVDKIFQQLKAGIDQSPLLQVKCASAPPVEADELERTADSLEALADTLAADAEVIARHSTHLQTLDIATQILRKLAAAG